MPKKKVESPEDRVIKLVIHRAQVLSILGDTEYAIGYLALECVASLSSVAASPTTLGVLPVNVQFAVLAHFQHARCAQEYEVVLPLL